jgi:hypothetical protein
MTDEECDFFLTHNLREHCVMGNDYYITNEHLLVGEDRAVFAGEVFGYYVVTRDYYNRYNLPVMHTETNKEEPDADRWLWKTWANIQRLRVDGVPLCGMTWYSLTDQVDWDTALREENGHVNPLGLYDLDRNLRPVGKAYQELIRQWSDTPLLPNGPLTLTGPWGDPDEPVRGAYNGHRKHQSRDRREAPVLRAADGGADRSEAPVGGGEVPGVPPRAVRDTGGMDDAGGGNPRE